MTDNNNTNKNLILIGNEIIKDSSSPKINNNKISNIINTREEIITKSINNEKDKTIKHYINTNTNININNNTNRNIFLHTINNPNETRRSTYYNLSKLNYKDGLILKDATNSNPGYGLWAIKLSEEQKPLKKKLDEIEDENNLINKYNSNIYSNKLFNDVNNIQLKENNVSESNIEISEFLDANLYEEEVDKIIINKLTMRSNKLTKRYQDMLHKYYERENLYLNLEKLKKEYEQLVNESIKEKKEIEKNCEKLDNNNQALVNSISNARKEIERLIIVIKEEQIKMKEEIKGYNKRLLEEEDKRKKIINQIKLSERQIYILQDKIDEDNKSDNNVDINTNTNTGGTNTSRDFNKTNKNEIDKSKLLLDDQTKKFYRLKKETKREKDLKISKKKEYITQLQEELERLKIEDEEKLKEKRELFELINEKNNNKKYYKKHMDKMYNELEIQERNNKWNKSSIKIRNNIIYSLKRYSNSK